MDQFIISYELVHFVFVLWSVYGLYYFVFVFVLVHFVFVIGPFCIWINSKLIQMLMQYIQHLTSTILHNISYDFIPGLESDSSGFQNSGLGLSEF